MNSLFRKLPAHFALASLVLSSCFTVGAQAPATPPPPSAQTATPDAPSVPPAPSGTLIEQSKTVPPSSVPPFSVQMQHSHNPFDPYRPVSVPPANLVNSPRVESLVRDGKLYLSLRDAIALALENNLDLAYFRYNLPIAEADVARTKAGGYANGVNVGTISGTPGGNGSSFGSGSATNSSGSANSSSGSAGGGAGGLVQSTLGSGTTVHSFDPQIYGQGYVDHTTQQLINTVTTGGVQQYHLNSTVGEMQYTQYFPLGTNMQFFFEGQRQTTNSAANAINPVLTTTFEFYVAQPLLAGFGFATNTRYIHISKNNQKLTDLGFKSQVIATVTQIENIYWDLANAYQDEQVKERSLQFANKTLDDDRKQLELQAIPAMQVMKDESDVATREGDLTVARATLRLNELYMKNALTKTAEDPTLEDMPVIPTSATGSGDENASRPIEELIAEAVKNRPDLAMDQISMETARISLNAVKNELLPTLNLYGEMYGTGIGGPTNPACTATGASCTVAGIPTGFGGSLQNAFNYTAPEYQVGFQMNITLRNRIAKADQYRSVLEYRQRELTFEQQKKGIRFDVRNSQFALQQARARVAAATKARDLAQRTFEITVEERKLGAKSTYDELTAQHDLAVAESALVTAQTNYEKAKVDIDRAIGDTLEHNGISIDDARTGVVNHMQP